MLGLGGDNSDGAVGTHSQEIRNIYISSRFFTPGLWSTMIYISCVQDHVAYVRNTMSSKVFNVNPGLGPFRRHVFHGVGTFYEGAMVKGYSTNATDSAVQANIVAAGYGK